MRFHCTLMESLATGERLPSQPAFDGVVQTQNSFIARVKRTGYRTRHIGWVELVLLDTNKLAVCYISDINEETQKHELVFPLLSGSEFGECKRHGNTITLLASRYSLILETEPAMAVNNDNRGSLTGRWQRLLGRLLEGEKARSGGAYFNGLGISVKQPSPAPTNRSQRSSRIPVPAQQNVMLSPPPSNPPPAPSNLQMQLPSMPAMPAFNAIPPSQSLKRISLCLSKPSDDFSGLGGLGFGEDLKSVLSALDEKKFDAEEEQEKPEKLQVEELKEESFKPPHAPFSSAASETSPSSNATTPSPDTLYLFPEGADSSTSLGNKQKEMPAKENNASAKSLDTVQPTARTAEKPSEEAIKKVSASGSSRRITMILEKEKEQEASIHKHASLRQPPSIPPPVLKHNKALQGPDLSKSKATKSVVISSSQPSVINEEDEFKAADETKDDELKAEDATKLDDHVAEHPAIHTAAEVLAASKEEQSEPKKHQRPARAKTMKSPNLVKTMRKFLGKRKKNVPAQQEHVPAEPIQRAAAPRPAKSAPSLLPLPIDEPNTEIKSYIEKPAEEPKSAVSAPAVPAPSVPAPAPPAPAPHVAKSVPNLLATEHTTESFGSLKSCAETVNDNRLSINESIGRTKSLRSPPLSGAPSFAARNISAVQLPFTLRETEDDNSSSKNNNKNDTNNETKLESSASSRRTVKSMSSAPAFCTANASNNGRQTVEVPRLDSSKSISALSFRTLSSRSLSSNTPSEEALQSAFGSSGNLRNYEKAIHKEWTDINELDEVDYFNGFNDGDLDNTPTVGVDYFNEYSSTSNSPSFNVGGSASQRPMLNTMDKSSGNKRGTSRHATKELSESPSVASFAKQQQEEDNDDFDSLPMPDQLGAENGRRLYVLSNKTAPALQHHSASSSYSSFASKYSLNSYTSMSSAGSFSTPALMSSGKPQLQQQDSPLQQRQPALHNRQSIMSLVPTAEVNLFVGYLWISKWENNCWNPLSQLELRTEVTAVDGNSSEIIIHEGNCTTNIKYTSECEVRRISVHDTELRTPDNIYMFRGRDAENSQKLFKTLWSIQANGVRAVTSALLTASLPSTPSNNTLSRLSFAEDDEFTLNRRKLNPSALSKYTKRSTSTILEE